MKIFLLLVLVCAFISCKETNRDPTVDEELEYMADQGIQPLEEEDMYDTKYVCAENGLKVRDENGTLVGKVDNGSPVYVNCYREEEITLQDNGREIKGRMVRIFYNRELEFDTYIFDGYLCDISEVKIYESELCALSDQFKYGESQVTCEEASLFGFEFIERSEYVNANDISIPETFIVDDTDISLDGNAMNLVTLEGDDIVLRDVEEENYSLNYSYEGFIPGAYSYVVKKKEFEKNDKVILFDRKTGQKIEELRTVPYVSIDENRLVSFSTNVHSKYSVIEYFRMDRQKIVEKKRMFFAKWAVAKYPGVKWVSNNELVLKVKHLHTEWTDEDAPNQQVQFMKITLR